MTISETKSCFEFSSFKSYYEFQISLTSSVMFYDMLSIIIIIIPSRNYANLEVYSFVNAFQACYNFDPFRYRVTVQFRSRLIDNVLLCFPQLAPDS